jgi:hypothetical protein
MIYRCAACDLFSRLFTVDACSIQLRVLLARNCEPLKTEQLHNTCTRPPEGKGNYVENGSGYFEAGRRPPGQRATAFGTSYFGRDLLMTVESR